MCSCSGASKDPRFEKLDSLLDQNQQSRGKLINVLQETQSIFGYLPVQAIDRISRQLRIPSSEIYGVATFYGQFHLKPRGKHIVRICTGTACHVRGGGKILEILKKELGLDGGELTTGDLMFTLEPVACIGACGMAPAMIIDEDVYGRLTPDQVPVILARYKEGEERVA